MRLVETVEDFGTQGERPTHPQNFARLACNRIPRARRLEPQGNAQADCHFRHLSSIVTDNEGVGRARPRMIVCLREVRASAFRRRRCETFPLEVSGLLSPKIGGPSVFPYQPEGIWTQIYSGDKWQPEQRRRQVSSRTLHVFGDAPRHIRRSCHLMRRAGNSSAPCACARTHRFRR